MATLSEMNLARLLDKMAADLANDLQWTLEQLDAVKMHTPKSEALAKRYVAAQQHLNTRRAYEAACAAPQGSGM